MRTNNDFWQKCVPYAKNAYVRAYLLVLFPLFFLQPLPLQQSFLSPKSRLKRKYCLYNCLFVYYPNPHPLTHADTHANRHANAPACSFWNYRFLFRINMHHLRIINVLAQKCLGISDSFPGHFLETKNEIWFICISIHIQMHIRMHIHTSAKA